MSYITTYHLWIKTLYLQTAEYEQLKTTTKYHKSDGPCLKALDKVLTTKNVQHQAYHGKSFIGNHVKKMLKVILFLIQNH